MRKWKCTKVNGTHGFTEGTVYKVGEDGIIHYDSKRECLGSDFVINGNKAKCWDATFEEVAEFDWNAFESEKLAVHCRTEKEAIDFCKQMAKRDLRWRGDDYVMASKTYWNEYKERMVYGCDNGVCYGTEDYGFKESKYDLIEWRDFMKNEFTKADLKPCMVVVLRSGDIARIEQLRDKLVICNSRNENSWNSLRYDENLLYTGVNGSGWDIMEVYGFGDVGSVNHLFKVGRRELLYKRVEKSPAQIKLEELETKQREIADEIKKVREEL